MESEYFNNCIEKIKELTSKKYVFFTKRGNSSIKEALKYSREKYDKLYFPDQGGWLTYEQFAKKFKFDYEIIKTNLSLYPNNLNLNDNSSLLINSMPAYSFLINLNDINFNGFIINDVSASIGTENAKYGDIIIGSFGRWKPINLGSGGFIATNLDDFKIDNNLDIDFKELLNKLNNLNNRLNFIKKIRNKVKNDLNNYDIIHKDYEGLNLIVKFNNDEEKEKLINYCLENNLEYTLCPMDIRVNIDAISIEIKRLEE